MVFVALPASTFIGVSASNCMFVAVLSHADAVGKIFEVANAMVDPVPLKFLSRGVGEHTYKLNNNLGVISFACRNKGSVEALHLSP